MNIADFYGLYTESWQGDIVPEAFSHPAKFSRGLIRRIYQHLLGKGYIMPGDTIGDPFGGVGLGALDAMMYGLHWQGVELEEKFVGLGRSNIALWNERYGRHFPQWGTAELHQGDSRNLISVLQTAGAVVSSPPYVDSLQPETEDQMARKQARIARAKSIYDGRSIEAPSSGKAALGGGYGVQPGQLGSMPEGDYSAVVSSPPFSGDKNLMPNNHQGVRSDMLVRGTDPESQTQNSPGNLALLRADEGDFAAVISSPAYGDTIKGGEGPGARHDPIYHNGDNAFKKSSQAAYGQTAGNLGNMLVVDGVVGSPPYATSNQDYETGYKYIDLDKRKCGPNQSQKQTSYGNSNGQLGNDQGDTFWSAALLIVEQCFTILKPGGVAVWVTGDFVRNRQRVFFGRQWLQLCESVGFVGVELIRAWKVRPGVVQLDIDGNHHDSTTEQTSFFRKLANRKNPEAAVRNEDVIILVKP